MSKKAKQKDTTREEAKLQKKERRVERKNEKQAAKEAKCDARNAQKEAKRDEKSAKKEAKHDEKSARKEAKREAKVKSRKETVPYEKRPGSNRRYIRWQKLDNTAILFPAIAGDSMTNVYRISVTLKEEIQPELLQQALDILLPKFDGFNVRLRSGFFWYYFEENGKKAPRVTEEQLFPCRYIQQNRNRNYLFHVTYYKNRINLEVFHVLADGMGGMTFLRELTYQYLRLTHSELMEKYGDSFHEDTALSVEDSFLRHYKRAKASSYKNKKAFLIKDDRLPAGEFGVMHGYMPLEQVKAAAHRYNASLNDYFVALFIYSAYKEYLRDMTSERAMRIAIPVNLRPYFESDTTRNFFIMVSAEFMPSKENATFEEILETIQVSLREQITKEHMEDLFSYTVANQENKFLRAVPLPLKTPAIRLVYNRLATANTSTVTNIGNWKLEEDYAQYVDKFSAFIAMSKGQDIKGAICSYNGTLCFTFSSILRETRLQKTFFRKLADEGVDVTIETNQVYY